MHIAGSVAVVTGASSGIGRALAVEFGLRGAKVVLAARSLDKLQETSALLTAYGSECILIPFDVTSESSLRELIARTLATYGKIDIFVNNAGIGLFENISSSDPKDVDAVFQTNFWGPLRAMQALVKVMERGTLVNVSSAAGKYAPSRQGIYAASKAALDRITEAFDNEEGNRLKILVVVPDRTATPFMEHVRGAKENAKLGLKLGFASAETVASRIAGAVAADKRVCYTTSRSRMYAILSALAPSLIRRIVRRTSE